jgi:hypothetical protein
MFPFNALHDFQRALRIILHFLLNRRKRLPPKVRGQLHLESIFISNLGATLCFFRQKKQRKQPSRSFRDILFPEVFRRKSLLSSKGRLEPVNFEKQN